MNIEPAPYYSIQNQQNMCLGFAVLLNSKAMFKMKKYLAEAFDSLK